MNILGRLAAHYGCGEAQDEDKDNECEQHGEYVLRKLSMRLRTVWKFHRKAASLNARYIYANTIVMMQLD